MIFKSKLMKTKVIHDDWQTLKTLLPDKSQTDIPVIKTATGTVNMVNGKQEVADAMNKFFSTVEGTC